MSRRDIMIEERNESISGGESPLKQLRAELEMSQEDFGRYIGVSVRTVSRWESGVNIPSFTIPQLKALDRLLRSNGKTIQDLPDTFAPVGITPEKEVKGKKQR